MIADAGHEIGLHGYSHENPKDMTLEQQTAVMVGLAAQVTPYPDAANTMRLPSSWSLGQMLQADPGVYWPTSTGDSRPLVGEQQRGSRAYAPIRSRI